MAINYTKIGWDTSKYINPTNMNRMDDGIKAACDGVDDINSKYYPKTGGNITGYAKISHNGAVNEVLYLNNTNTAVDSTYMAFEQDGTNIGYIGVKASTNKPVFKLAGGADKEIALKEATATQENIGYAAPNTTTRFTIPTSMVQTGAVYLIAIANTYGVGSVYLFFRANSLSSGNVQPLVSQYFTITAVSDTQFDVAATGADGTVVITKLT